MNDVCVVDSVSVVFLTGADERWNWLTNLVVRKVQIPILDVVNFHLAE
jgi:hypothetical protein